MNVYFEWNRFYVVDHSSEEQKCCFTIDTNRI